MKTFLKPLLSVLLLVAVVALSGCMRYTRLIPENKSARIRIVNPLYGYVEIDTRVVGDTNGLSPLPDPDSAVVGPGRVVPVQPVQPFVPSPYQNTPVLQHQR